MNSDLPINNERRFVKIIEYFSKLNIRPIMGGVFAGFNFTKEEAKSIITDIITSATSGQTDLISMLIVDNAVRQFSFTHNDILDLLEIIYQHLSSNTKKISDTIRDAIVNDTFTVESFMEIRKN